MYILIFYTILIVTALLVAASNLDLFSHSNITYLPENFIKGFVDSLLIN